MKLDFHKTIETPSVLEEDFTPVNIQDSLEKTRQDLEIAYAGFNNAVEIDLIDSYIYEINSLQKRYKHLTTLAALEPAADTERLYQHSAIRTLVSHVFS
ncbi:MAG: YaaL family protein [Candidatus Gastranaerophilales bacterium]|nr:YaaL family protein [Candidatus Gastranaerophilales bacterium]